MISCKSIEEVTLKLNLLTCMLATMICCTDCHRLFCGKLHFNIVISNYHLPTAGPSQHSHFHLLLSVFHPSLENALISSLTVSALAFSTNPQLPLLIWSSICYQLYEYGPCPLAISCMNMVQLSPILNYH